MIPLRILVVDDERPQLEVLQRWLAHSGYDPVTAASGAEALAIFEQEPFEVVVTDLRMPGISGLELLAAIKERSPDTEVIFLSGQSTMQDAVEALRGGRAFEFLQKPLRDLGRLNAVIEKARAARAARLEGRA